MNTNTSIPAEKIAAEQNQDHCLEQAGRRIALYLRHVPIPERSRHELALRTLDKLAENPGPGAETRAIAIVRDLLAANPPHVHALPAMQVHRRHMKPEEMDRRPWVRFLLRQWRPLWVRSANFFNTPCMDILLYSLILAGLYLQDYA